jgi:hypothetical protein
MRRAPLLLLAAALLAATFASPASASFGLKDIQVSFGEADGTPATQAGSHPFAMTTSFRLNEAGGGEFPDGAIKDFEAEQAAWSRIRPRCRAAAPSTSCVAT